MDRLLNWKKYACIAAFALAIAGCADRREDSLLGRTGAPLSVASAVRTQSARRLSENLSGLNNVVLAGAGIYSGGEPHGDEAFASLARLGVKTIVSVDGAKPDLEKAHRYGIRYVHIPIGYDGVHEPARLTLTRVARDADRPIYVHCHHGRHRGPAATAIVCIAAGQARGEDALLILEAAGTGREYPGLWRDVEGFSPPASGAALPELTEFAQVESLPAAMASVDRHWDNLKRCQEANWQTPRDPTDLSPAQQALLLRESLHEAGRTAPRERFDGQFREWLDGAESLAAQIEAEIRDARFDDLSRSVQILEEACKTCHVKYRN
jgi:protein tyrosine phosphatase (PTP) superfamily phosphohydrolase (DUF442 family)